MFELLSTTVITLADDVLGNAKVDATGPDFSPFTISNETGIVLWYGRSRAGAPEAMLVPGEQQSFDFWPELADRILLCSSGGAPSTALSLGFESWDQCDDVNISRVGQVRLGPVPYSVGGSCLSYSP